MHLVASPTARDERGSLIVFAGIFVPVAILLVSLVMNVGNWFQHARHLQLQADAAVLAGANQFQLPCSPAIDTAAENTATNYSGTTAGSYNRQSGGGYVENFNQTLFPGSTPSTSGPNQFQTNGPTDTTVNAIPPSGTNAGPCEADMLDVKLNDLNLPWYFQLANVPFINAHARASILSESNAAGVIPLAVQTSSPKAAEAFFIDETTGAQLSTANAPEPTFIDTGNQATTGQASGEEIWGTSPFSLTIPSGTPNIGVIIALAQSASMLGSSMTTVCGTAGVECFDQSPGPSLVNVQTWTTATGSPIAPHFESAQLYNVAGYAGAPAPCPDQYYENDFSSGPATCSVGMYAKIDVGATPNPAGLTVSAIVNGGTPSPLCYQTSGALQGSWATDPPGTVGSACPPLSIPAANTDGTSNSYQVDLSVTCTKNTTPGCTNTTTTNSAGSGRNPGPFPDGVQRAYAADATTSGPIGFLTLAQGATADADSFEACDASDSNSCTYSGLSLTMDVQGLVNATSGGGTPVLLHLQLTASASNSGIVDCTGKGASAVAAAIITGCPGTYVINGAPEDPHGSDTACTFVAPTVGNEPWDCLQAASGFKTGQIKSSILSRICGTATGCNGPTGNVNAAGQPITAYCPNNWPAAGQPLASIPANDSRLITMFVTPFASLATGKLFQVVGFGSFYVVGFPGDPCAPPDPTTPANGPNSLAVLGYFVKRIDPNPGSSGGGLCNQTGFGNCVIGLTQ